MPYDNNDSDPDDRTPAQLVALNVQIRVAETLPHSTVNWPRFPVKIWKAFKYSVQVSFARLPFIGTLLQVVGLL